MTRAETRELAGLLGFPFVDDPANRDASFRRVRIRRALAAWERALAPGIGVRLAEMSRLVEADLRFLDGLGAEVKVEESGGRVRIPAPVLNTLPADSGGPGGPSSLAGGGRRISGDQKRRRGGPGGGEGRRPRTNIRRAAGREGRRPCTDRRGAPDGGARPAPVGCFGAGPLGRLDLGGADVRRAAPRPIPSRSGRRCSTPALSRLLSRSAPATAAPPPVGGLSRER